MVEPATYVATCVHVPADEQDAYVTRLAERGMPVWRALVREGLLASRVVFREYKTVGLRARALGREAAEGPHWTFLHFARLSAGVRPEELLRAEEERLAKTGCDNIPGARPLRVEVLRTTPNSYFPEPPARTAWLGRFPVRYQVEYIRVEEAFVDEYRSIMAEKCGPAMGMVRERGLAGVFVALETASVEFAEKGMPSWNQVHLLGYSPALAVPWFLAFARALKRTGPDDRGFGAVFGRLRRIRKQVRTSMSVPVAPLMLPGEGRSF